MVTAAADFSWRMKLFLALEDEDALLFAGDGGGKAAVADVF